jgi:sugar (pentulose or hexulose) kinase
VTLTLALDVGTSGVRSAVVEPDGTLVAEARIAGADERGPGDEVDAEGWWRRAEACLAAQAEALGAAGRTMGEVGRLSCDGTSGTVVLVDARGDPVSPGLPYDSAGFDAEAAALGVGAPSAAARALSLVPRAAAPVHVAHQADFVLARLGAPPGVTDENNALKTGYDPERRAWPVRIAAHPALGTLLPRVHPVGAPIGEVGPRGLALGLPEGCAIHAGTTDSVAAFLATGARGAGDAVTSLGTTLAVKLVSPRRVEDPARGVYSHRVGDLWLAGGASNTGGGVLAAHFPPDRLEALSAAIDPGRPTGLDYHPLLRPGERFPVADPHLAPRLDPRPEDDAAFLQGMLEGIARIEAEGYAALADLGAPPPRRVLTVGGGARNEAWAAIRSRALGVPVERAGATEASVGLARHVARIG